MFCYGDKVVISEGFFTGLKGIIKATKRTFWFQKVYQVKIDENLKLRVKENSLELVKNNG